MIDTCNILDIIELQVFFIFVNRQKWQGFKKEFSIKHLGIAEIERYRKRASRYPTFKIDRVRPPTSPDQGQGFLNS